MNETVKGYWIEGERYLQVIQRAWPGKKAFTPEIIYHMAGMAIEKFIMAWTASRGTMPENHTLRDLVRAADSLESLPGTLRRDLLRMDRFMGLCSLDPVRMPPPEPTDVPEFITLATMVYEYVAPRLELDVVLS